MFANNQCPAISLSFPDVCLTPQPVGPPVPVPYANTSQHATAVGFVPNVILSGGFAHNVTTTVPMSSGDEPGTNGGVASGMFAGPTRFVAGSATVLFGGQPATRLSSPTQQNGNNAPGITQTPGQMKVLLLS